MKNNSITTKILWAMLLGFILGSILNLFPENNILISEYLVGGLFHVFGTIFINSLKMLVVPLVTFSLICGVYGLGDINSLGRIGVKAFGLYLATTGIAISLSMLIANVFNPGKGFENPPESSNEFIAGNAPPVSEVFINMIPENPIHSFAEGSMLQIIFFVILFSIALLMTGESGKKIAEGAEHFNEVMMKVVNIVMGFAPYGIFFLMAKTFSEQGIGLIIPMFGYFATVMVCLLIHAFGSMSLLLWVFARLNPMIFIRKMRSARIFAFSTASSNATIPVTMQVCEERLGVDNSTASFTIPFGATINMDGTAIMQGVATVFIANVYGIDLSLSQYLTIIGMSILASVGTAGVPGVGLIMLAMVFNQVGLPVEGIALIIGVDRILDMVRTVVNVTGDSAVTCIIANSEGKLDRDVYNDPNAGHVEIEELPHK